MFLEKYISLPVLFVSFIVGLICIFIFGPETKTIYVYPSVEKYNDILYKDKADRCFQMIPKPVECDSTAATIPVQD